MTHNILKPLSEIISEIEKRVFYDTTPLELRTHIRGTFGYYQRPVTRRDIEFIAEQIMGDNNED